MYVKGYHAIEQRVTLPWSGEALRLVFERDPSAQAPQEPVEFVALPEGVDACYTAWEDFGSVDAANTSLCRGVPVPHPIAVWWRWVTSDTSPPPLRQDLWVTFDAAGAERRWFKRPDADCDELVEVAAGEIRGRVGDWSPELCGHFWAVAFCDGAVVVSARVRDDGTFSIRAPEGRYGLQIGDDSCHAVFEASQLYALDDFDVPANPWASAAVVEVVAGRASHEVLVNAKTWLKEK